MAQHAPQKPYESCARRKRSRDGHPVSWPKQFPKFGGSGPITFHTGKQSVYHALQDSSDGNAAEVIESLDHDIKKFQDQLTTLRAHEKQTRAELAEFAARPLLSEIRSDIGRFQGEKDRMIAELGKPGEDISETMPAEEQEGIEKEWKYWQRQANVRRRICRELWGRCSEVLPDDMTEDELKVRRVESCERGGQIADYYYRNRWDWKGCECRGHLILDTDQRVRRKG